MEYNQDMRPGILSGDGNPGDRVREKLDSIRPDASSGGYGPDIGQDGGLLSSMNFPDNPGPAAAGRTPMLGSVRRSNDMMVVRDQVAEALGN